MSGARATNGVPTYVGRGDPAGRFAAGRSGDVEEEIDGRPL